MGVPMRPLGRPHAWAKTQFVENMIDKQVRVAEYEFLMVHLQTKPKTGYQHKAGRFVGWALPILL